MKNIYDGVVITDGSGYAVVEMPAWFEALNRDFRYQLTPVGQFAQVMVASDLDAMIARRIRDPGLHQRKEWNFDIGEGGCYRGGR